MTRPASLKDSMPETADWVNARRVQWGRAHVDDCLRRAMAGEPGYFYAMEGGFVVGTPWPAGAVVEGAPFLASPPAAPKPGAKPAVVDVQRAALLFGATFAAFMREPGEVADGAH